MKSSLLGKFSPNFNVYFLDRFTNNLKKFYLRLKIPPSGKKNSEKKKNGEWEKRKDSFNDRRSKY
jgi:hypothetical protein